jgi:digeranylgeranylglycerophospholipid reductase
VGLGVNGKHSRKKSPKKFLEEFIRTYFPEASILRVTVGGIPCAKTLERIAGDGIMLVGDAAHQVNPMSGGGITTGMWGGRLAGSLAAASIKKGDVTYRSLREYEKQWHDLYGKSHQRWYRIKEAVNRMTDKNFNDLMTVISSLPSQERNLMNIFKHAFFTQPKLILDLMGVFSK